MSDNPYQAPIEIGEIKESPPPKKNDPGVAAYNIVSDTIVGPNLRWRDNLFQALFIFVSILVFALVGAILAFFNPRWNLPWFGGVIFGAFAGLLFGTFASGIFLMIYRGLRHLKGKHD
ncbi:MAG: hypothetical protein JNL67_18035 [Planctomycetaceae bacterium]|nr:hypothetical protein [Planctomycetaceae bacterium]